MWVPSSGYVGGSLVPALLLEVEQIEPHVGLCAADALVRVDHADVQAPGAFLVVLYVLVVVQVPRTSFLGMLLLQALEGAPVELLSLGALLAPPGRFHCSGHLGR